MTPQGASQAELEQLRASGSTGTNGPRLAPAHYILLAVIIAASLGASVLLIPNEGDIALLYFKDGQYETAKRVFLDQLAPGPLSTSTVKTLTELHLAFGDVDEAVTSMERFTRDHPSNIEAVRRLGKYYQYAQRPHQYLLTLEQLSRLEPSEDNLRELSSTYDFVGEYDKQIAILQTLVERYPENRQDFLELAYLQASRGLLAASVATLHKFEALHPDAVTAETTELLVSLTLDLGHPDLALAHASRWLSRQPHAETAARFASVLHERGQTAQALRLLQPFESAASDSPYVLATLTQLEIAHGDGDHAFARLRPLYSDGRLPDSAFESFISLSLSRQDVALAFEAVQGRGLSPLPDWLRLHLADAAVSANHPALARWLIRSPSDDFLEDYPVLAGQLALTRADLVSTAHWVAKAKANPSLSIQQKATLAELLDRIGREQDAFDVLVHLASLDDAPDASIAALAGHYLRRGETADGLVVFERLRSRRPSPEIDGGWARLAAGAGQANRVIAWLDAAAGEVGDQLLTDLYFIASDNGETALSVVSAEELYRRRAGNRERFLLSNALMAAGRPADALPHLRRLLPGGHEEETAYAAALSAALEQGAPVGEELRTWLAQELAEPGLPAARRAELVYSLLALEAYATVLPALADLAHQQADPWLFAYVEAAVKAGRETELVEFLREELGRTERSAKAKEAHLYALMEHGGDAAALPYLREFARIPGGSWVFAYEAALRRLARHGELLAFWRGRAARTDLSSLERRSVADNLLQAGQKELAEQVLLGLANDAPPDSRDVSQLLYLWGPRPASWDLDWLQARAQASAGAARAAWMNHLTNAGAARRAMAVVGERWALSRWESAVLDAYLDALRAVQDGAALSAVVDPQIDLESDPRRLRRFGRLSVEFGQDATAYKAYTKLLSVAPDDPEALKRLGILAYFEADYSLTRHYLSRYLRLREGDYETHYYYGEALRRTDQAAAAVHYERALRQIEYASEMSLVMRVMRALVLHRTGRTEESLAAFETLLAERPDDKTLRADYIALLLDQRRPGAAHRILSMPSARTDKSPVRASVPRDLRRIVLTWPQPVGFRASVEGRELLLQFESALELAQIENFTKPPSTWIEGMSVGFDTLLLRAGRDVDYTVRGMGREVVITLAESSSSATHPAAGDADAQLRLELLQARLLADTGHQSEALRTVQDVARRYPANAQVLASLADIENRIGRWRRADALYGQALDRRPGNEDIVQALESLRDEHASRVQLQTQRKVVHNVQAEQITQVRGNGRLTDSLRVGFAWDQNLVDVLRIRRSGGRVGSFEGIRHRGEISIQQDYVNGSRIQAALFASRATVGLGLQYAATDTRGRTSVLMEYRRPYWEFIEAVVDGGVRDRLEIRRQHNIGLRLTATVAVALNRYGVDGDSNVGTSLGIEGGLRYALLQSKVPLLVEYRFDGESRRSIGTWTGADGVRFSPLPLVSREVHAVNALTATGLISHLRAEGFAGLAWDRLGGRGPFFGGRITYDRPGALGAQLSFDRSLYVVKTVERLNRFGGSLFWRF